MVNYRKIQQDYPLAYKVFKDELKQTQSSTKLYDFFDGKGVRLYMSYGASGGYKPEIRRKRSNEEFLAFHSSNNLELNWKMKRIGFIQSFTTRKEAEIFGFTKAFEALEFILNNQK